MEPPLPCCYCDKGAGGAAATSLLALIHLAAVIGLVVSVFVVYKISKHGLLLCHARKLTEEYDGRQR
jgi:hypothetical protein